MARRNEHLYSRFVVWAKIILPLLGLAILSSLFLFSKSREVGKVVRLFDGTLTDFASKEQITGPRFSGMTPSGAAIEISAKRANPRAGGAAFDAIGLNARIETPEGTNVTVKATSGSIDSLSRIARLAGGITLTTSGGYVANTRAMQFALDKVDIVSNGKITATGPLGKITAGRMHLWYDSTNPARGYVLVFNNRVKLVYNPEK